ncbi:MAG: hypothetical protein ACE5EQ_03790 [Phycisphaerae bacterium]
MLRMIVTHKSWKWSLLLASAVFGILPGGCEETILRAVTPLLI